MSDGEQTQQRAADIVPPDPFLTRVPIGLRQFVKFGIVGGTGTLINLAVFSLLLYIWHHTHGAHAGIFEQVASGIAFCMAVVSNFALNRHWTFRHTGRIIPHFGRFFIVSLVGLGLNVVSFTLMHNLAGIEEHISQLLAIFIVTPFNFIGSKWWAFR